MVYAYLAFGQLRLNGGPCLGLGSIGEQVHDDGTLGNGFVHLEQICAWHPTILHSFLPRCAILSHTDDDIETVVAEIETLAVTLRAVADQGEGVILEVFLPTLSTVLSCEEGCIHRSLPGASLWANPLSRTPAPCAQQSQRSSHLSSAAPGPRKHS